ncbi:hypothetical protein BCV72DRAFT_238619 [Rhizopus microsporus var. microsporus]|nr:hypothetical protein BCV72DRAFT_238619 [Rhizopus microsporus var. microsporus]
MVPKSLTDLLWKEIDSFCYDVSLLKNYKFKTSDNVKKSFTNAIKNIKKRKNYNSRLMGYKLENTKRNLDQVNTTLKSIIDQQVDVGIDNLTYFALVEGYGWYLYRMNLSYDDECRSHLLMLLLPAINALSYLNDELAVLKSKLLGISKTRQGKSTAPSFKKLSFNKTARI